jgi:hypothetical protein
MWRRVGLVRTEMSEERVASIFRVERNPRAKKSVRPLRRHIPEDGILHSHRFENFKSYKLIFIETVARYMFRYFDQRQAVLLNCLP